MKYCPDCKTNKKKVEFTKNRSKKDGLNRICKTCYSSYRKKYYQKNKKIILLNRKKSKKAILRSSKDFILHYLLKHPCLDCGEKDIRVLEFDHKIRDKKKHNVMAMLQQGYSVEKIKEEINKCDVRCANCHRIKTINEDDSWRKEHGQVV